MPANSRWDLIQRLKGQMKNPSDTIHIVNIFTTAFKIFKDELFLDVHIYCTRPQ